MKYVAFLSLLVWMPALCCEAAEKPLNVLFIMADQHNAQALGCYGNKEVKTPNLDRLAAAGVRFENAFCQTGQCCPSRFTLITGRYAHSHGVDWNGVLEPLTEVTLPNLLHDAGYATATIGKHHFFRPPIKHGFELTVDRHDYDAFVHDEGQVACWRKGDFLKIPFTGPVGPSHSDNDHHTSGFYANRMIEFIQENKDRPFCGWLSFYGPHTPIVPSRPWADMYDADDMTLPGNYDAEPPSQLRVAVAKRKSYGKMTDQNHRQVLAQYYGLVSQIDANIGRVLDELERLGIADRTIIVYTADHGELMSAFCTWTKHTVSWDATVRVPLILSGPGVPHNKVVTELVGLVDLMPTLCELTGQKIPDKVQGRSLIPLAEGTADNWREVIFSEIGRSDEAGRSVMARTKTHKYIHHENRGRPVEVLYDLRSDPWERNNVAQEPEYAAVLAELKESVNNWEASTDHSPALPVLSKRDQQSILGR